MWHHQANLEDERVPNGSAAGRKEGRKGRGLWMSDETTVSGPGWESGTVGMNPGQFQGSRSSRRGSMAHSPRQAGWFARPLDVSWLAGPLGCWTASSAASAPSALY